MSKIKELKGVGHCGLRIELDLIDEMRIALLANDLKLLMEDRKEFLLKIDNYTEEQYEKMPETKTLIKLGRLLERLTSVPLTEGEPLEDILKEE